MGFNIGVSARGYSFDEDNEEDLFVFINRSYYNFVTSYQAFGDESVLMQTGKYLELDLIPITRLVYTLDEVDEDFIEANLQKTEDVLTLAKNFYQKVKEHPEVFQEITYQDGWSGIMWREYASSGQVYEDLECLIKAIQVFKDAGFEQVYFDAD